MLDDDFKAKDRIWLRWEVSEEDADEAPEKEDKVTDIANRIPAALRRIRFVDYKISAYTADPTKEAAEKAKTIAERYTELYPEMFENGKGLYFYSKTAGSGKTHLAVATINEIMDGYSEDIGYITCEALSREQEGLIHLVNIPLLLIDGIQKSTIWGEESLYFLLNERMLNNRVTFFTGSCEIAEINTNDALKQRIEIATVPIHLPEESVRQRLATEENEQLLRRLLA